MIIIGFVLILAAAAAGVGMFMGGMASATVEAFGLRMNGTVSAFFLLGAVTMFVLLLGLWLIGTGLKRSHRRRRELKVLRQQAEEPPPAPAPTRNRTAETREAETRDAGTGDAGTWPTRSPDSGHDGAPVDRKPASNATDERLAPRSDTPTAGTTAGTAAHRDERV